MLGQQVSCVLQYDLRSMHPPHNPWSQIPLQQSLLPAQVAGTRLHARQTPEPVTVLKSAHPSPSDPQQSLPNEQA